MKHIKTVGVRLVADDGVTVVAKTRYPAVIPGRNHVVELLLAVCPKQRLGRRIMHEQHRKHRKNATS